MTDIVERLRKYISVEAREGADEILRLRALLSEADSLLRDLDTHLFEVTDPGLDDRLREWVGRPAHTASEGRT